jgi:hypothetical protein
VSVLLTVAAIVTVAGALVAITGRDARVAVVGLVVTMAAAPFLADPLPNWPALAARVVAALLGGYLLFVVLRDTTAVTRGSLVGLPAETLAAAAAFVVGWGTSGLGSAPIGPAQASAAGFALAVISVAPIVRGADVFRLGVALAVLVTGAELVRVGLAGTPPPLEQLMTAGLTIGLLGTAAVLCISGVAATGGLALRNEPRRSALFEAHPVTPTAASSLRPAWLSRRPDRFRRSARAADAQRIGAGDRSGRAASQAEPWPGEAAGPADSAGLADSARATEARGQADAAADAATPEHADADTRADAAGPTGGSPGELDLHGGPSDTGASRPPSTGAPPDPPGP